MENVRYSRIKKVGFTIKIRSELIRIVNMQGLSTRNLKYMRAFAAAWPDKTIVQQRVSQIPWGSNIALLDKLNSPQERLWYAQKTIENGWSQPVLAFQIESCLYDRQGKTINNFSVTLPPEQSDMAEQIFKDPYLFDFLVRSG